MQPERRDDKAPLGAAAHEPGNRRRAQAAGERRVCAFCTQRFRTIQSSAESKNLTQSRMPAIVISSSGMATGGRVLHHLKAALPDSRNTVLLVGFQAEGTRGRSLLDGARTIKIHGQEVPVDAQVDRIESMSAHADSAEILRWLEGFTRPPTTTFLVHGEPAAMDALSASISTKLGWNTHMPRLGEAVTLGS
ncbi:MAG: MBL fold metallo-hydrolase RNA specificity domain-containing protein [Burkholderiales bacterium]